MDVSKQNEKINTLPTNQTNSFQGKHFLLELYNCDPFKLNDELYIRCAIDNAAKVANAQVLNLVSHKFYPQGLTAIALLSESQLSIHTWPESSYAAVDIFTCGINMKPELASQFLIKNLHASSNSLKKLTREFPLELKNQLRESF